MEIKKDLCANAIRKVALLITKASKLGMDILGYDMTQEEEDILDEIISDKEAAKEKMDAQIEQGKESKPEDVKPEDTKPEAKPTNLSQPEPLVPAPENIEFASL